MRWEYKLISIGYNSIDDFEALKDVGQNGWELVAVCDNVAYLKRPISLKDDDEITVNIGGRPFQVKVGDLNWKPGSWGE